MKCRFIKPIFQNKENGYCIFVYHTEDDSVPAQARSQYYKGSGYQFTAIGNNLPDTDSIEIDMQGKWIKSNYGLQLQVDTYEEILPQTKEGIMGYLSSGMVKGIGPKTARLIVDRFGTRTFDILDNYPDSLLEIKGITQKKLDTILLSYRSSHAMRDLAAYLTPFNVTPKKIQKIYEHFGNNALDTVKSQPFMLCQISGFGFLTVDEIAKANKCRLNDPMRIEGCIHYCMELEMQEGHLYADKQLFQKKVYEQLNHGYQNEVVSEVEVYQELYRMVKEHILYYEDNALYTARLYGYECGAAKKLATLLVQETIVSNKLEALIAEAQRELGILLSAKQVEGVRKAFTHLVSIITGGPGTGKTTVQKVLLYINEKLGGKNVLLTAPTGRASRRMAESTGHPDAITMHSALGLTNDEDCEAVEEMLDADFIIGDEFTMSDMRLSYEFFSHIKEGTRLVLVGDVNQLPSVGPGNVFRELVMCGVIPVTVLDMVFRQAENSRIAINAYRMQENNATLDYGTGFELIHADTAEEAADKVEKLYREAIAEYGVDQVQVLTPFRKRGEASVDALNARLWEIVNPMEEGKQEMKAGKRSYREGDRIIHNKNKNQISNGDVGYMTDIYQDEEGVQLARLQFSDGRSVNYTSDELDMIEHAYATTVHKSQGSEYPVVILPWLPMFYKMLRRNILYTAVTRAKVRVAIVGNKKAIYMAIHNTESDKRNTRLGERVIREYNRLTTDKKIAV
ncbi:MAG: ATP-dependent RecD-like DNA helicase [Lachnospiraceae bacterium]|nr:ATP-dependent RecD-like DNA helicase [Lachnospiraceae bacterium]